MHNTSGKAVSIWSIETSKLVASSSGTALDRALTVLRHEVAVLSKIRHPSILQVVEPLEEARTGYLRFVTEPVLSSLQASLAASIQAQDSLRQRNQSSRHQQPISNDLELDEVEIQKGLSQVAHGLSFIHTKLALVHGNLTPDSIIINAKGDWKLAGFGCSIELRSKLGEPARWEFPEWDRAIPASCQRDYDYIAPEAILDESPPAPSMDLYSLGCILHSISTKAGPPFSNRHSLSNARTNIEQGLTGGLIRSAWIKLSPEIQAALAGLLTRYPAQRLGIDAFLESEYFSSLLVKTLRFLERENFSAVSAEGKAGFLRGLITSELYNLLQIWSGIGLTVGVDDSLTAIQCQNLSTKDSPITFRGNTTILYSTLPASQHFLYFFQDGCCTSLFLSQSMW